MEKSYNFRESYAFNSGLPVPTQTGTFLTGDIMNEMDREIKHWQILLESEMKRADKAEAKIRELEEKLELRRYMDNVYSIGAPSGNPEYPIKLLIRWKDEIYSYN